MQPYTSIAVVLWKTARATSDITDPEERYRIANEFMAWYEITDEDWQLFLKQISTRVFSGQNERPDRPSRNYFCHQDLLSESHDFNQGTDFNPYLKKSALKKPKRSKPKRENSDETATVQRPEKPFIAHDAEKMLDVPEIEYFPEPKELIKATNEWSEQKNLSWAEALKQVLDDRKIFGKHRLILIYGIERILRERRKLEAEKVKRQEMFREKIAARISLTEKIDETYKRPTAQEIAEKAKNESDDQEILPF